MPFNATVEVKTMLAAVRRATSLISRSTVPVLGFVKLSAKGARLVVGGTNLDCWLESSFEAEAVDGGALVPGKDLESALAVLPPGAHARLVVETSRMAITCGRTKIDLPTLPVEDWPVGAEPETPVFVTLATKGFLSNLEALRPAISTDPSRRYITGVYLDFELGRMVATTGMMLGWDQACWELDGAEEKPKSVILPGDILNPLKKLLDGQDQCELLIDAAGNRVKFLADGQSLTSKVIDGQYPRYSSAVPMPKSTVQIFRAGKDDVISTLKRVGWIPDDKSETVVLTFAGGELTIGVRTADGGESEDACGARLVSGSGDATVKLPSKQLAWAIESLPLSEAVDINYCDATTAVVFTVQGDSDRNSIRVVMPVR